MISALNSTLSSAYQSLTQETQATASAEELDDLDELDVDAMVVEESDAAAGTTDPDTAVAVASSANTQSSLSVTGAQAVESSDRANGDNAARMTAANAPRADAGTMAPAQDAVEDEGDLNRSRAEAIAAQNRERQESVVASIAKGADAPRIERVEAAPSSKEAATRYSAANTPAAPAAAMAELRA